MDKEKKKTEKWSWENTVPWILTISSLIVLITIGIFLVLNIEWFKKYALSEQLVLDKEYSIYIYHLHLAMIKRSIGLFSGFALLFIGTSVAFYSIKNQSKLELESSLITAKLATATPGIIAMLLGVVLIIFTIESKDTFTPYDETERLNEIQKNKVDIPERFR